MQPIEGEIDPTGFQKYELQPENRQDVAENLLMGKPDLIQRSISVSEPSKLQTFKEKLFDGLGF